MLYDDYIFKYQKTAQQAKSNIFDSLHHLFSLARRFVYLTQLRWLTITYFAVFSYGSVIRTGHYSLKCRMKKCCLRWVPSWPPFTENNFGYFYHDRVEHTSLESHSYRKLWVSVCLKTVLMVNLLVKPVHVDPHAVHIKGNTNNFSSIAQNVRTTKTWMLPFGITMTIILIFLKECYTFIHQCCIILIKKL